MKVPFVDLKAQYDSIRSEIDAAMSAVISESAFIGGKHVEEFEQKFARMYGVKHCISCGNGTDSLYILYRMLGIGPGDEVITVANSWISTSETISQCGAKPVFVDMEDRYFTMNPDLIREKVTPRTRAIVPVHLYGQMCDMEKIMGIANEFGIPVIEDCAQSHFSELRGKRAGLFGTAGSFSFYPGKNLGAYGDAGCIITNDEELALKCRMFARHGSIVKHDHRMEGINSRLDGLQAAILSVKLDHIHEWTERRIAAAQRYHELLTGTPGITLPQVRPQSRHTFHLFVIRARRRKQLQEFLKSQGVETAIHYPVPLPYLIPYRHLNHQPADFPESWAAHEEIFSLPIFPEITEQQIRYVSDCIHAFCKKVPETIE